ncbi:MAG: A/G-specific adenine glycosylase [Betaproteobacteria bacterium]|nr:A/G-specific adenine glycosylase [Betaproteobacteria bacterium]
MKSAQEKQILKGRKQPVDFDFSGMLIAWQKQYGRHVLPWQQTRDAYRVWLSEIMLQQTQVTTVIPYYARFLMRFPDVAALASAELEDVMAQWSGLGYYSRARNLHRCAQMVVEEYNGHFPCDPVVLETLPGIGRSTAAAISVFSSGGRAAILDGNVIRVLSRVFGIVEYAGNKKVKDGLWQLAESLLPDRELEAYTQGLMDLGATVCVRNNPSCRFCPFASHCVAFRDDKVKDLPVRKPFKALPEKQVCMFILIHEGQVMLEKRPAPGIWGGLFSLPELAETEPDAVKMVLESRVQPFGEMVSYQMLGGFVHTFTHFRLQVTPVLVELASRAEKLPGVQYVWQEMKDVEEAALPSPVKKLLLKMKPFL